MKITGSYTIDAPRDQVWAALNDIEVLARIVPGCERLEQIGENEFQGTVKIGIQSIKGTYSGKIRLEDIQPPSHYKLVASGRSASGVVDGAGGVDLAEQDGKTVLTYTGNAQIGGTLASVGQRLIEGASKQLINQSLKALVEQISARAGQGEASSQPAPAPAPTPAATLNGAASATLPAPPAAAAPAAPAVDAEVEQARPVTASTAATTREAPAASAVAPPRQPSFERRAVVVPDHEQLKPAAVVRGVVDDIITERPWLLWVAVFLLGFLLGRAGRRA
ncbi:MAG TPA: carbon monoxide dehydrogenase subunit G [Roseiflexaceae bacterium]